MAFNIGYTATLKYGSTQVASLSDIKVPKVSIEKVPATTLDQATNIKQYIPGMRENGEIQATALWVAEEYATLRGLVGTSETWHITMPDTTDYAWTGFLMEVGEVSISDDKTIEYPISICVLSDVTVSGG